MKPLFFVGANLLGIYLIINGLIEVLVLVNQGGANPFAVQIAISCSVKLIAGTALTFFTEFIAKGVRIPESVDQPPAVSFRNALEVGIILLGLMELVSLVPRMVQRLSEYLQDARIRPAADLLGMDTVALAACLLMIFFAHRIAAILGRVNQHPPGL
jgi:hypothetical protein